MAYCTGCGQELTTGAAFCAKCGAPTGAAPSATPAPAASTSLDPQNPTAGISENLAGLLCYVLGWLTGLIFILIDKRPFVRFRFGWSMGFMLHGLLNIAGLVAWIICMVKAFKGERYKLPIIGDMAENYAR